MMTLRVTLQEQESKLMMMTLMTLTLQEQEEIILMMKTPMTLTLQEQEEMIRRITLYVVPVIFAIVLIIGLIGNTLVIGVVRRRK